MGAFILAFISTVGIFAFALVMGGVIRVIMYPILKPLNDQTAKAKAESVPMCARRQQEVFDSHLNILTTSHNLRNESIWDVEEKYHCSREKAMMIMIEHDCEDMGIKMNYDYAALTTGYREEVNREIELADQKNKTPVWKSEPLPGHEGKTLTFAQAKERMNHTNVKENAK